MEGWGPVCLRSYSWILVDPRNPQGTSLLIPDGAQPGPLPAGALSMKATRSGKGRPSFCPSWLPVAPVSVCTCLQPGILVWKREIIIAPCQGCPEHKIQPSCLLACFSLPLLPVHLSYLQNAHQHPQGQTGPRPSSCRKSSWVSSY